MIEGLHFDVTAKEMAEHLTARKCWHHDRTTFYKLKADGLEKGGAEAAQFSGGDPIRSLRESQSKHEARADFFGFLERHVVPGETYRLSHEELETLEFVVRGTRW